jgi:hypothetical protein
VCLKIECNGRIRWTDDDGKALVKYFNYQDGAIRFTIYGKCDVCGTEHFLVPKSSYLRESCRRLTIDTEYKKAIERKQAKDKEKPAYFNANKGGRL